MPVQFPAVAVIEHWIKTLNELGMEEQAGKDTIGSNYLGAWFNNMLGL